MLAKAGLFPRGVGDWRSLFEAWFVMLLGVRGLFLLYAFGCGDGECLSALTFVAEVSSRSVACPML